MIAIDEAVERLYDALIWELRGARTMTEFRIAKMVIARKLKEKVRASIEPKQPGEGRLQLGSYEVDGVHKVEFPDTL